MQRVFITGANRGIGLELVRQYAYRGDRVFAGVRSPDGAGELSALAYASEGRITMVQIDVADQSSVDAAAASTQQSTDVLDVLINNAGILFPGDRLGALTREHFRETFEVNVIAPAMVT